MKFAYDIPDSFWSLFRSMNRELYMEALLKINEEYEYNNYYLSKEVCLQVLEDWNESQRIWLSPEEFESETDASQTPPNRILNWLIKTGWLKRIEDFSTLTTNIIIPDYAAVFLTAFEELVNPSTDDTEIYIQNVYATLFSFWHDKKMNLAMLKTALVNTKKLNKALQDMLHNMDHFFSRLLKQKSYEEVLAEHLEGYVEEIVEKKYHILKTNDNFYLYKNDIKRCLREMREDIPWMEQVQKKNILGTEPIGGLLRQFAVPSIIAMLVGALYNIVDQFFIGNLMIVYIFMGQDDGISTVGIRFAARIIISDGISFSLVIVMLSCLPGRFFSRICDQFCVIEFPDDISVIIHLHQIQLILICIFSTTLSGSSHYIPTRKDLVRKSAKTCPQIHFVSVHIDQKCSFCGWINCVSVIRFLFVIY